MIKIASFHGRMGRQAFFAMTVLLNLAGLVFIVFAGTGILSLLSPSSVDLPNNISESLHDVQLPMYLGWALLIFGLTGLLWVFIGLIAISVRRLHDLSLAGYLVLLLPALQVVMHAAHWAAFPLLGPAYIVWTAILTVAPGTRGANLFGPERAKDGAFVPD